MTVATTGIAIVRSIYAALAASTSHETLFNLLKTNGLMDETYADFIKTSTEMINSAVINNEKLMNKYREVVRDCDYYKLPAIDEAVALNTESLNMQRSVLDNEISTVRTAILMKACMDH